MKYLITLLIAIGLVFTGYKLAEAAVQMTAEDVTNRNTPLYLYDICDDIESGALVQLNGDFCEPTLEVTTNNGSQLDTFNPQAAGENK